MMPSGWSVYSLDEIAEKIGDGLHGTPKYDETGEFYFVNGNNIKNGKILLDSSTKKISRDEFKKLDKKLNNNTLLLSINGTIGNLAYYKNEKVALGKSAAYITLKNDLSRDFIFYCLSGKSVQSYFLNELTGSTIKNLSLKTIRNTKIPIPPQVEQEKIAKILSTWDEAIEKLEKIEKSLNNRHFYLRKKCFDVHGTVTDLKDMVEIIYGKSPKGHIVENGIFPIVGTSGVVGRTNSPITSDDTVIIGRKGTIDNPIYMSGPCLPIDTTFWTKPKTGCQLRWLFHLVRYLDLSKYNEASGVPSLSRENLYKVKAPVHSASTQEKIIQILDCSQSEIDKLIGFRKALQTQKQGLMQQLLTGKKRVQV